MKPFILEFIGGCWDGMNLCSHSPDPVELKLAKTCYAETGAGAVGKTTLVPAEYGTRRGSSRGNRYVVVHRMETGGEVLVRLNVCSGGRVAEDPCHDKQVLLDFEGGVLHGLRLDSASEELKEALLATSYYCLTEQGTTGAALVCGTHWLPQGAEGMQDTPAAGDAYVVVSRQETDNEIAVRLQWRAMQE